MTEQRPKYCNEQESKHRKAAGPGLDPAPDRLAIAVDEHAVEESQRQQQTQTDDSDAEDTWIWKVHSSL